jgi:hypothetical protein
MQASVAVKEKVPGAIPFAEDCVSLDGGKLVSFLRESGGLVILGSRDLF